MPTSADPYRVEDHFAGKAPSVKATYQTVVKAAKQFGSVHEDPKKTSIHLVRKSAFAGVATRKSGLILTFKSKTDLESERIIRREQASSSRWHLEVKLESPSDVDAELKGWLKSAYEISG